MSVDLHALIPLIALTFLLAGFVKGVVGLGLPTVSVGLLGLAMPPMQAAALLIVPSMVTNVRYLLFLKFATCHASSLKAFIYQATVFLWFSCCLIRLTTFSSNTGNIWGSWQSEIGSLRWRLTP